MLWKRGQKGPGEKVQVDYGLTYFFRGVGNLREAFAWVDGYGWLRLPIFKQEKFMMIKREEPGQSQLLPGYAHSD